MPCAKLSGESTVLFSGGWGGVGGRSGTVKIWGVDRHGKWHAEDVVLSASGAERQVYLGTQGGFAALAASSRVTVRDGSGANVLSLVEDSRIGEMWFELPGEVPEEAISDGPGPAVSALRQAAVFEAGEAFALRRRWPSGERLGGDLRGIIQSVKSGATEFCVFRSGDLGAFISKGWATALGQIVQYCFTNEEGYQEFDRKHGALVAWHVSGLRAREVSYRVSYETLQNTRGVYVSAVQDPLPPIARGGCACVGAADADVVQLTWATGSWSPVVGGFFLRGA